MNKDWEQAIAEYENIEIPRELETIIVKEIEKDRQKVKMKKTPKVRHFLQTAAACAVIFIGSVNVSQTVALAMYDVPVLGNLARMVTFREYKYQDSYVEMDLHMPSLNNTGNAALEERINSAIEEKMRQVIDSNMLDAQQRKTIAEEKGHTEEEIYQKGVFADAEVKYQQGDILSFVITTLETAGSSDTQLYCVNVNIQTGEDVTLADLLGKNYKKRVDESIQEQIASRMKADENQVFFGFSQVDKEMGIEGFTGISEDQAFYINAEGNPVIVFQKYQIAPGYMGTPEFEIQ